MKTRHLLIAAYSGMALLLLAALATAIHVAMAPQAATTTLLMVTVGVNLLAWGLGHFLFRRPSAAGGQQLLIALGDALLPLNVYLVAISLLTPIVGHALLSAWLAASVSLAYGIFADLAGRHVPLTAHAHRAYLFTFGLAASASLSAATFGLSASWLALALAGALGIITALCYAIRSPIRAHYAIAGMIAILAGMGSLAPSFAQRPDQLSLLAAWINAVWLFAIALANRETGIGKVVGFGAWAGLTLALAATLYFFHWWVTPNMIFAGLWVAALMYLWRLFGPKRFAPLKEPAYWFAIAFSLLVISLFGPLWRHWATVHFGALINPLREAPAFSVIPSSDNLWRVATLAIMMVATAVGFILRRAEHRSATAQASPDSWIAQIDGVLPPVLSVVVLSTVAAKAFGTTAWVVTLLVVLGTAYCWLSVHSARFYPSGILAWVGYGTLLIAVVTAGLQAPTTLVTLVVVVVILFVLSELNQSATAYAVGLTCLVAAFLLGSFGLYPQQPLLAVSVGYVILLVLIHWWFYRSRPTRAPFVSGTTLQLDAAVTQNSGEHAGNARPQAVITLIATLLLGLFILIASVLRREYHPVSFLLVAATLAPLRAVWELSELTLAGRPARWLWLIGCYVGHAAVGFLLYSLLRYLNIGAEWHGLSFAGLAGVYLTGYIWQPREPVRSTRISMTPFVHLFSLAAIFFLVRQTPLGIIMVVTWLMLIVAQMYLSAHEETQSLYPVRPLRIVSYGGLLVVLVYALWQIAPSLSARAPLPSLFEQWLSGPARVHTLFGLALLFTILLNRSRWLSEALISVAVLAVALASVALTDASFSIALCGGLFYIYLLSVGRLQLLQTSEEPFNLTVPRWMLGLASIVLALIVGLSAAERQFDTTVFLMLSAGFLVLSFGWEHRLLSPVSRLLRLSLLTSYALGHATVAVTVYALVSAYGLTVSYHGLALAVLAGFHVIGFWFLRQQQRAPLRQAVVGVVGVLLAAISLTMTLVFVSDSMANALTILLLTLVATIAYLVSLDQPTAIAQHHQHSHERSPRRWWHRVLLGAVSLLIVFLGGRFILTGELPYLIASGVGAVVAIHLLVRTGVGAWLVYLSGLVLVVEALWVLLVTPTDLAKVAGVAAIGVLVIADLLYLYGYSTQQSEEATPSSADQLIAASAARSEAEVEPESASSASTARSEAEVEPGSASSGAGDAPVDGSSMQEQTPTSSEVSAGS
ncbi:MAG: hypothetical protein RMM98_03845 [Acidobacteriota bacterium]|nr:hypothetical protein [Acidobacteriota bacterium]